MSDSFEFNSDSETPQSLKLALLASSLTTVADAIATLATLLAIDETKEANLQAEQEKQDINQQLLNLQYQLDDLTNSHQQQQERLDQVINSLNSIQKMIIDKNL
ncbi:hypothetical protein [Piscibacillus salipiscarius]|uniref:Uncharacterized protein n=1 Tax=Piscibacillus salipiscarius TaxID=299480 RepID=A0ABW5Q6Z5_9BACI|nr:hypothetical protein [Piscibacillus salipiscarius]